MPVTRRLPLAWMVAAGLLAAAIGPSRTWAEDDPDLLLHKALTAAVDRVAPCVVRIETVGGMERVDEVLFGTGPTTGLVIDPQGYILSSSFNFINKPASILVRLPDGNRKAAKLVATDHNRKMVLLKVEPERPLAVPEIVAESEMRVGQWCAAVGRTFDAERPNMAVGILSAVGRVWGKALQTDAAVSPNNYGGPLVDIYGRAMGILAPLSPQSTEEMAGYEWYDSGIGFAVPLEQMQRVLPRLKKGEDLFAGVAGFTMQSRNLYTGDTVIASCRPKSPAEKAGFKPLDRIVEIAGHAVDRSADVKQQISMHYAGDKISVAARRGDQRIQHDIELVARLDPYEHPFLGVLPLRGAGRKGIAVRYVYPESPAAKAKMVAGDVLVSVAGKPAANRDEVLEQIAGFEPGQEIAVEVRHSDHVEKLAVKLDRLPDGLPPPDLPSAHPARKAAAGAAKGVVSLSVPEFKNEVWAYVPENYEAANTYGVVVWLQGTAPVDQKEMLPKWKAVCDQRDLILIVPKAAAEGWQADSVTLVEKLIRQAKASYNLDPARVVVGGREGGATLAFMTAMQHRELIRGVAVTDMMAMLPPLENEPQNRLAIFWAAAKASPKASAVGRLVKRLRDAKLSVTLKELGDKPRDLTVEEIGELGRWIDMLDRI